MLTIESDINGFQRCLSNRFLFRASVKVKAECSMSMGKNGGFLMQKKGIQCSCLPTELEKSCSNRFV